MTTNFAADLLAEPENQPKHTKPEFRTRFKVYTRVAKTMTVDRPPTLEQAKTGQEGSL